MILVDAHVHIYDCFDLEKFFDAAYANFKSAAEQLSHGSDLTGILLLAETSKDDWFQRLADYADGNELPEGKDTGNWNFRRADEAHSLLAESGDSKNLILIAGRQIVAREGLEILALFTTERFEDGAPIEKLIDDIIDKDAVPVIPWGVGKWFGNRGKVVKKIIENHNNALFYLGDNGNRPVFWPQPKLFRQAGQRGIQVLPGSDPLPFVSESVRAGSYGFVMQTQIDFKESAMLIKQMLIDGANNALRVFGRLEKSHRFLLNQLRTQVRKRFTQTNRQAMHLPA